MSKPIKNCTGVILAGGENRRMPVLKAFIKINGKTIIDKNLKIMQSLFNEVFIATNQPEKYLYTGIPLFGDIFNVRSPMTGVLTTLLNTANQWMFVTACDMPFISENLIRYAAGKRGNDEAVVPVLKNKMEPLFAFYSKKLIIDMEKSINAGKTGLKDFLKDKRVKYLYTEEIRSIDKDAKSFINLNTPEDVKYHLYS